MCSRQHELRRNACLQRFDPSCRAQTPPIARLQAGKAKLRVWRREIVAPGDTEIQKFAGHSDTNDVRTDVFIARVAAAVAIKACSRSFAT